MPGCSPDQRDVANSFAIAPGYKTSLFKSHSNYASSFPLSLTQYIAHTELRKWQLLRSANSGSSKTCNIPLCNCIHCGQPSVECYAVCNVNAYKLVYKIILDAQQTAEAPQDKGRKYIPQRRYIICILIAFRVSNAAYKGLIPPSPFNFSDELCENPKCRVLPCRAETIIL